MPNANTNRPADPRCRVACDDTDASGVCPVCEHASCELCDTPVTREQVAASLAVTGGPASSGVFCAGCLGTVEQEDSGGVPVEVPAEESGAQTVRAIYEPIGDAGLGDVRATRKAAA